MLEVVKPEQGGLQALACNCHIKDILYCQSYNEKKLEAEVIEQILFQMLEWRNSLEPLNRDNVPVIMTKKDIAAFVLRLFILSDLLNMETVQVIF